MNQGTDWESAFREASDFPAGAGATRSVREVVSSHKRGVQLDNAELA